jgi:hypothetical protein
MCRLVLSALLALCLFAGGLLAGEGVVVSFEKDKLVVKVGAKQKTYTLQRGTHVHDVDGSEIKLADRAKHLKKGVTVDVEEEGGKVAEINIKKK